MNSTCSIELSPTNECAAEEEDDEMNEMEFRSRGAGVSDLGSDFVWRDILFLWEKRAMVRKECRIQSIEKIRFMSVRLSLDALQESTLSCRLVWKRSVQYTGSIIFLKKSERRSFWLQHSHSSIESLFV